MIHQQEVSDAKQKVEDRMKTLLVTIACLALTIANSAAQDTAGRWGMPSEAPEWGTSLIDRSADEQMKTDTMSKGKDQVPPKDFIELDVPPTIVKQVEPVYPEEAIRNKIEGKVWVKIWIDIEGKVRDVVLLKSTADILNDPAIEAARQLVFTPAYVNKEPVAVWVSVPFKFKLPSSKTSSGEVEKATEQFLTMVREVIEQDNKVKAEAMLNPEAYMIDGTRFKSIPEILQTGRKGNAILAEQTRKITFTKVKIADDGKWAYMVLRTESQRSGDQRYHTILFSRDSAGVWHIEHWHVSK